MDRQPENSTRRPSGSPGASGGGGAPLAAIMEYRRRDLRAVLAVNRLMLEFLETCALRQIKGWGQLSQAAMQTSEELTSSQASVDADRLVGGAMAGSLDVACAQLFELSDLALRTNARIAEILQGHMASVIAEMTAATTVRLGTSAEKTG